MQNRIRHFRSDESGAVTVDWVVLTAAVVALAIGVLQIVGGAIFDPANGIGATVISAANIDYDL